MTWRTWIMRRSLWIQAHLWLAAFFAPALLLMAISGGLYLLGIKGTVDATPVTLWAGATLDLDSADLEGDVRRLLTAAGVDHSFEYLKLDGSTLTTRPTSRVYYVLEVGESGVSVSRNEPDLQKRMIELHKGHGPTAFKNFQKFMAAGLLLIVLNGFVIGLAAVTLRTRTLVLSGLGLLLFLVLVFFT